MGRKGSRFAARRQITFTRPFTSAFVRPLAPCVARPTRSVVKRYLSPILDSPKCSCKQRSRSESDRRVSLKNLRRYSFLAESVKLLAQLCLSFSKYFHLSTYFFNHDDIERRFIFRIYFSIYIYLLSDYLFAIVVHLCFEKRVRFAFRTVLIRVFIGLFSQDKYFYEVADTRRYRTLSRRKHVVIYRARRSPLIVPTPFYKTITRDRAALIGRKSSRYFD